MTDNNLTKVLVCPICKNNVSIDLDNHKIICNKCKLFYPIENDIPIMLINKAKQIYE